MNLHDTHLDQIGASAHGHYTVAEKAAGKSEEHYKSAGIYLKHAKLRVLKTRGLTWERWLMDHCPISRSRADEVISISDGRIDLTEHRAKDAERKREARKNDRDVPADRSEKRNENNERPPYVQPEAAPATPEEEAEEARTLILNAVILKVRHLSTTELWKLKVQLS